MYTSTANERQHDNIFLYLLLFTCAFLLLECSNLLQSLSAYIPDLGPIAKNIQLPPGSMLDMAEIIGAQLLLHLMFCCLIYLYAKALIYLFKVPRASQLKLALSLWLLGLATVLITNQHLYPNSHFAGLLSIILFHPLLQQGAFFISLFICALITLLIIISALKILIHYPEYLASCLFAFCLLGILYLYYKDKQFPHPVGTETQPNIIFIGVDSLRPDFLSYFGGDTQTPYIDSFLTQSVVFSEAVTPLARTFPSWVGILTGKYPKETGARSNLVPLDTLTMDDALPASLKQVGYQTIYATDETRFSNIDQRYGFDQIIGPPMGLNDFLLGTFNDFPFSNLIINTHLGKWLFPYSYANRAVYTTYDPDSFLNLLNENIHPQSKPLFLIVHLCLPHFPYLWASLSGDAYTPLARYPEAVKRVDQQISLLFNMLAQKKLLEHAVVVLLSDHGEALELPGDRLTEKQAYISSKQQSPPRFYPPSLEDEGINQSAGHGTDVLGLTQYHTVLAFRFYNLNKHYVGTVPGLVSTLDIKPTILQLLNLDPATDASLVSAFDGNALNKRKRDIFLESDYSPESMRMVFPDVSQVLLEGVQLFQVDPRTRLLVMKPEMEDMVIKSKQYADIYGDWMVALYPQSQNKTIIILINLVTGKWTDDLDSDFAVHSPVRHMLEQLRSFYGDEITV